jgi:hypothetical protein
MSTQVTIQVAEHIMNRAAAVASYKQQSIEEVITHSLEAAPFELPIESLPDAEVLQLAAMKFTPAQQEKFGDLLDRNRENELDATGRRELDQMMRLYEQGLLRKAEALQEAVTRGLMEPLTP